MLSSSRDTHVLEGQNDVQDVGSGIELPRLGLACGSDRALREHLVGWHGLSQAKLLNAESGALPAM